MISLRRLWPSVVTPMLLLLCATPVTSQVRRGTDEGRLLRDAAARESRGDFDGAESALRRLLEADPASSGGLFALERVLRAKGETAEILGVVDAFLARDATASGVRYLKLRVLMEFDSLDALEHEAERWFELDSTSEIPYQEVARVYERAFGADRALEVLRRGREAAGGDALALEIGDLLITTGDYAGGVDEWVRAIGDDGAQSTAITRRVRGLTQGRAEAGRRLVQALARADELPRRRAGARVALDLALGPEALDLSKSVASDLNGRARELFLNDVARRAREKNLNQTASWALSELGGNASSPAQRRQFDQRILDVALAAADTAGALEAQRRIADSFSEGSVDRRRATAQVIRLDGAGGDPERLGALLKNFRDEFPGAPELDDLAATVAAGLLARGDAVGAAAVLEGIEGPRSGIERAYLLFDAGEVEEGRRALLFTLPGLEPSDATEVIQLVGLMGRLSPEGAELVAAAGVRAHRGQPSEAARALTEGVGSLVEDEHPPMLAQAARIAQRGELLSEAALIRERILTEFPDSPEAGEAALALARYRATTGDGVPAAIALLEELITSRPNAAVVPDARLELERLRGRGR
jgi:tetratricopeptide (TPR) repeat protein